MEPSQELEDVNHGRTKYTKAKFPLWGYDLQSHPVRDTPAEEFL